MVKDNGYVLIKGLFIQELVERNLRFVYIKAKIGPIILSASVFQYYLDHNCVQVCSWGAINTDPTIIQTFPK